MLKLFIPLILISMFIMAGISCRNTPSIEDAMVQIWDGVESQVGGDTLMSFGTVVGDGTQILTVINYGSYTPGDLLVGLPGKNKYRASIQVIDPRTSVTLLKLEDIKFPPVTIGDPASFKMGSEVFIHGWTGPGYDKLEKREAFFHGYGLSAYQEEGTYVDSPGAAVTDANDNVIGLVGTFYDAFVYRTIGPGMTAPIININNALELLVTGAADQPWTKGSAFALITTKESVAGHAPLHPTPAKYNEMAAAITLLLETMGDPLPADELPDNYRAFLFGGSENPPDGTLLSVVYPKPIELRNTVGQVVAEAKWAGFQWGRSEGKQNRLFYGHIESGNAIVKGGFVLNGDVSTLENSLH